MVEIREYGYGLVVEIDGVRREINPSDLEEYVTCALEYADQFNGGYTRITELETEVQHLEAECEDLRRVIAKLKATWTPPTTLNLSVKDFTSR